MRRIWLGFLAALALAVTACGGGSHHSSSAPTTASGTPRLAPTTTHATTTLPPDPAVVPPVITPAYVNAVLAQLNHVYGNAVRTELGTDNVPPVVVAAVRAIFNDPEFSEQLKILTQAIIPLPTNLKQPPGDRSTKVQKLISNTESCIFVQTTTDYSAVDVTTVPQTGSEFFELAPKAAGHDPQSLNPTPWAIQLSESFQSQQQVTDPCTG